MAPREAAISSRGGSNRVLLGGLMVLVLVGLATKSTSLQLHTQVGWRWSAAREGVRKSRLSDCPAVGDCVSHGGADCAATVELRVCKQGFLVLQLRVLASRGRAGRRTASYIDARGARASEGTSVRVPQSRRRRRPIAPTVPPYSTQ